MSYLSNKLKAKTAKYLGRKRRANTKVKALKPEVRVLVERSNKFVTAQAIALDGTVLAHISSKATAGGSKSENAKKAGIEFAKLLKDKKVDKVAFDRNGILYHGRIAAFADGLREGGVTV